MALKPLTAGKPKKGLVNDSDFNKDAVQNVQREVLTLPQERRREKAVTIAQLKQLQKVKAYRTLRIEQVNQRYKGIREKRRKEEEEKKKQWRTSIKIPSIFIFTQLDRIKKSLSLTEIKNISHNQLKKKKI